MLTPLIPIEGGLYVVRFDNHYRVLKLLKVEDKIIHVRIYKNRFEAIPGRVDPSVLSLGTIHDPDGSGVGHTPIKLKTFVSWRPQFLQHSLVESEELDGYKYWKEAGGEPWA